MHVLLSFVKVYFYFSMQLNHTKNKSLRLNKNKGELWLKIHVDCKKTTIPILSFQI